MLRRALLSALAVIALGCTKARGEPSGVLLNPRLAPVQQPALPEDMQRLARSSYDNAVLQPMARYRIAARVLSSERYYLGWSAELAPLDLALGWGALSDPAVDEMLDWYQGSRWYFWQWNGTPSLSNGDVAAQSANVHVVPASPNLKRALLALDAGDIVQLKGFLVNIEGRDGEHWRSSLTREDTGGGSCELLYTTELIANDTVYH